MAADHQLTFDAFGIVVRLESPQAEVLEAIGKAVLLPGWATTQAPPQLHYHLRWSQSKHMYVLRVQDSDICNGAILEKFGPAVRAIVHHQIATNSDQIFLHAAALEVGGQGLVLPGRTYTGKSTLTWALLKAGARLLSDEYAVLSPETGLIRPFSRPVHLRSKHGYRAPKATALATQPVPAAHLLFLEYRQDSAPLALHPLTTGQATLKLMEHMVAAKRMLPARMGLLTEMVRKCQSHSGLRGDAELAARHILDVIAPPN